MIYGVVFVGKMRNLLTTYFSNVHQHLKHVLYSGSRQLLESSHPNRFLTIWIISSEDFQKMGNLIIFSGYYGIFGRIKMQRFIQTKMETERNYFAWPNWKVRSGKKHSRW